jgi:enamine deaminase RidA (YjgF/YER057c/UK114 family)
MTAQAGLAMPTLLKEILKTFDDITVMDKIVKDYEQQMQQRQQIEEQKFQAQNKGNPQSQQVSQVPNQPPNAQGQVNR